MKKQMTALVLGAALSLSAATAVPFETSVFRSPPQPLFRLKPR